MHLLFLFLFLFFPGFSSAAPPTATTIANLPTALSITTATDQLILLGVLPFIPLALLSLTYFTRIIVIFSLLKQGLGLTNTPPNMLLIALALILTSIGMKPVLEPIYQQVFLPWQSGSFDLFTALQNARPFIEKFLEQHISASALNALNISNIANASIFEKMGAFIISELNLALQFGLLIIIPFMLIDLLVASVLMSLGLMMLSPVMISLPIKIAFFLYLDGWSMITKLILGSL